MSVMVLADKHINTLVSFAKQSQVHYYYRDKWHFPEDEAGRLAKLLSKVNHAAYDERYKEIAVTESWMLTQFKEVDVKEMAVLQVLKLLYAYTYQCDGWKGWEKSEARAFCDYMRDILVGLLPGYHDLDWTLED